MAFSIQSFLRLPVHSVNPPSHHKDTGVTNTHRSSLRQRPSPSQEGLGVNIKLQRREIWLSSLISLVLAPLTSVHASENKTTHLPITKIKEIIENDIKNGQYYVTGNLTKEIYDDNCRFVDPTTDVRGVNNYIAAIRLLFDPKSSHHELLSIDVNNEDTIQAKWRLQGYLKLPWHPHILPYEGTTLYRLNNDGIISSHEETWNISIWTAFRELFTPS